MELDLEGFEIVEFNRVYQGSSASILGEVDDCRGDDVFVFEDNGAFIIYDMGEACNGADKYVGTWELLELDTLPDGTYLNFEGISSDYSLHQAFSIGSSIGGVAYKVALFDSSEIRIRNGFYSYDINTGNIEFDSTSYDELVLMKID